MFLRNKSLGKYITKASLNFQARFFAFGEGGVFFLHNQPNQSFRLHEDVLVLHDDGIDHLAVNRQIVPAFEQPPFVYELGDLLGSHATVG